MANYWQRVAEMGADDSPYRATFAQCDPHQAVVDVFDARHNVEFPEMYKLIGLIDRFSAGGAQ